MRSGLRLLLAALALSGCAQQTTRPPSAGTTLTPLAYSALPGWSEDHQGEALTAFITGCAHLPPLPGGTGLAATLGGTAQSWQPACTAAAQTAKTDTQARTFFEAWFTPYAIQTPNTQALFTGYYEPEIPGSRAPGPGTDVGLLATPPDLITADLGSFSDDLKGHHITGRIEGHSFVPYYTRAEIEAGALSAKRLEFLWLANPIDAFFLQIQGSGRIRLQDGRIVRVSYAAQNGRPYVAIGRVLADMGEIPLDQVSLPSIRAWLNSHPDRAADIMNRNPSFVFFRELPGARPDQGPPGSAGAPLTPGRSAAIDRTQLPLQAPVFITTTDPLNNTPWRHLLIAQDTGGAIKGPTRADIFFGWGPDAEALAGHMRGHGAMFVLLPKTAPSP